MNMSYCRWHNTLSALRDCASSLPGFDGDDAEKPSRDEAYARRQLFDLMSEMLEAIGVDIDPGEVTNAVVALNKEQGVQP